jgi:hypothetical protein
VMMALQMRDKSAAVDVVQDHERQPCDERVRDSKIRQAISNCESQQEYACNNRKPREPIRPRM